MPYLIDRQVAWWTGDLVAVVTGARRGERSRVTLRDNSLRRTASRSRALVKAGRRYPETVARLGARRRAGSADTMERGRSKGAAWWKPQ
ncbi:MAG: hypothetical protein A3D28_01460 [Omnitrophica bacterium RIFCSPHIGHO2_02_FULL_63_14]|nr:MAG: hypothetical protein A3D28_01460 [Omnitrophica bacterium RIFCSPHIGHO2_02_FULL_63_14]